MDALGLVLIGEMCKGREWVVAHRDEIWAAYPAERPWTPPQWVYGPAE